MRQPIIIERTYPATLQEVWDLWTTKDGFASWWGPVGFRVEVHTLDARVGGTIHYDMIAATPEMVAAMAEIGEAPSHENRGTFVEVQPMERLVIRFAIDFLRDVAPYESNIAVALLRQGNKVTMRVTLEGLHDDKHTQMQAEGFTSQLTKLDGRFGGT